MNADDDRPPRSRPLNRERQAERERERQRRPRELTSRDLALLSTPESRTEERDSREDKTREQETEDSLEFSRRGMCGENWGESTD